MKQKSLRLLRATPARYFNVIRRRNKEELLEEDYERGVGVSADADADIGGQNPMNDNQEDGPREPSDEGDSKDLVDQCSDADEMKNN